MHLFQGHFISKDTVQVSIEWFFIAVCIQYVQSLLELTYIVN
jgi:hypothetical protein